MLFKGLVAGPQCAEPRATPLTPIGAAPEAKQRGMGGWTDAFPAREPKNANSSSGAGFHPDPPYWKRVGGLR